jgi:cell shape-determining protein MreC
VTEWAVPLGALVVSLATLIFAAISTRRSAAERSVDLIQRRVREHSERVAELERLLADSERQRRQLLEENLELMRMLRKSGPIQ